MSLDGPLSDKALAAKARERGATVVGAAAAATPAPPGIASVLRPSLATALPTGVTEIMLGPGSPLHELHQVQRQRKRREDLEHPIQRAVIAWADDPATLPEYPELKSLYAIPNAGGAGKSKRQRQLEGARQRDEGLRKGMPDLCLPCPRRVTSAASSPLGVTGKTFVAGALYVEMKAESGAVRKAQRERIAQLRAAGNRCEVAMSADAAQAIITSYLQLPRP